MRLKYWPELDDETWDFMMAVVYNAKHPEDRDHAWVATS
jgi:hypothetical protein